MTITNITIAIDARHEQRLVEWATGKLIPEAMTTVDGARLMRVAGPQEPGCATYAMHIESNDDVKGALWVNERGLPMLQELRSAIGAEAIAWFVTTLEVIL